MSPEEVSTLLQYVAALLENLEGSESVEGLLQKLDNLVFLMQVTALGIACVWGALIWQAVIVGKNQRRL